MISDGETLWDLFGYAPTARRQPSYLTRYNRRIERHKAKILESAPLSYRYMLAGLFHSYRAANHDGSNMDTTVEGMDGLSFTDRRLRAFGAVTAVDITSNAQYRAMIGHRPYRWALMGHDRALVRFVLKGAVNPAPDAARRITAILDET